jgi:hypothetical protein
MLMEQQAQRMNAAESIRQDACASGSFAQCSSAGISWQSEQNLYQSLQERYRQCRQRSGGSFPLRTFNTSIGGRGLGMDTLRFDVER